MMHADDPDMSSPDDGQPLRVWTIGHSTLELGAFLALLRAHAIEALVDVRRFPGSRRHPHFAREALCASLPEAGIAYHWLPDLGGRRSARKDSHNDGWRNASFRGYADYMETPAFALALDALLRIAQSHRTVFMCAEHAWQQCHRGLISDRLKAQGIEVVHIQGGNRTQVHPFTEPARIVDGQLSYAASTRQGALPL
jgi:uncharacterized protein (DUF488 family)